MAFAPCTACGSGFRGAASTFFPALVRGGERQSVRHKLCPVDSERLHDWAVEHLSLVSEGDSFFEQQPVKTCSNCGGDLVDPYAFFLNEYLRGQQDRQFYGQVCFACTSVVAEEWGIGA